MFSAVINNKSESYLFRCQHLDEMINTTLVSGKCEAEASG